MLSGEQFFLIAREHEQAIVTRDKISESFGGGIGSRMGMGGWFPERQEFADRGSFEGTIKSHEHQNPDRTPTKSRSSIVANARLWSVFYFLSVLIIPTTYEYIKPSVKH